MKTQKRALLIAGGGTLGTYATKELLDRGHLVDVICLEDRVSEDPRLRFFTAYATEEYLADLFEKQHYDGIINFLHYKDAEDFKRAYPLLMKGADHLIFLSSYRTYADEMHPITEEAPRLLDVVRDSEFLEKEDYALPKARCEDFLRNMHAGENWTIVRPVISFSALRLDLFMYSRHRVPQAALEGTPVIMPAFAKKLTAGLDWAGNSGKLIARLLFNPWAYGQTYTISTGQNLTWEQVAQIYTKLTGVEIRWESEAAFLEAHPMKTLQQNWAYVYDRKFDRTVDASKVLRDTGTRPEEITPIEEGLRIELARAGYGNERFKK